MQATNFLRIFKDNSHYASNGKYPFLDSLARVVVDYIFSEKFATGDCQVSLSNDYIHLYDYMTLVVFIIDESRKEFGDVTIKEWLYTYSKSPFHDGAVEYVKEGDGLRINDGGWDLQLALLWGAYIYANVRHLDKDDKWGEAVTMLYNLMLEASGLKEHYFKQSALIVKADEACNTMVRYIKNSIAAKKQQKEAAQKEAAAANDSNKDALIAKLKADFARVQAENAQLKEGDKDKEPVNAFGKIIFFATVLSAAYDETFTNQLELSKFICSICGGSTSTFQPRISKLSKMAVNDKYSDEVKNAAKKIVERLKKVPKGDDKENPRIIDIIKSIEDEFHLRKNK